MIDLKTLLGTGVSITVIILALILFNPDKFEKWLAICYRAMNLFPTVFRSAHRRYSRYDLQGRVNEFVRSFSAVAGTPDVGKVRLAWVDPGLNREAFLESDTVVIRLKRDDAPGENFVHAAYLFVSYALIHRMKPYLSDDQRAGFDLYVLATLLKREHPEYLDHFLREYLHKGDADSASDYFDLLAMSDRSGLLYSMLLPELDYFADKIFGDRLRPEIVDEVDGLMHFCDTVARRRYRQNIEMTYFANFCRVGVVILGQKRKTAAGIHPWTSYIQRALVPRRTESIYIIGPQDNEELIRALAASLSPSYAAVYPPRQRALLPGQDDVVREVYVSGAILRHRGADVFESRTVKEMAGAYSDILKPDTTQLKNPSLNQLGFVERFGVRGYGFLSIPSDADANSIYFNRGVCTNGPEFIELGSLVECDVRCDDSGKWFATRVVFLTG